MYKRQAAAALRSGVRRCRRRSAASGGYSQFADASSRVVEHTYEMTDVAGAQDTPSAQDGAWGGASFV